MPAALVLLLRFLQVRSSAHVLYHGEFAGIARLFRRLEEGTFAWRGPAEFVHETTYQWFAQGTSFLQVLALLLEPIFGRTLWGHWGAAALLEALAVALFAGTITRIASPGLGLLAGLALALPPNAALSWNLQPYGNHNEFLWVPLGVAFWLAGRDPMDRTWRGLLPPVLLLGAGFVLYRANVFAAAALIPVLAWPLSRARIGRAALVGGGVVGLAVAIFAFLGQPVWGGPPEGHLGSFPDPGPGLRRAFDGFRAAFDSQIPAFAQGPDSGRLHRLLILATPLLVGLATLRRAPLDPARRVGLFAALWAAAALAVPIVTGNAIGRYLLPGWCAATLALATLLAAQGPIRRVATALFAVFVGLGVLTSAPWIERSTWDQTRHLRGIELWYDLEVNYVDLDELPFYARLIDEGRASVHVGVSSHHPSGECPSNPGAHPADRPDPSADTCSGWPEGALAHVLVSTASRFGTDVEARKAALRDVGRGIWIRANRRVPAVEVAIRGAPGELTAPVLEGARDEAARWAGLDGR